MPRPSSDLCGDLNALVDRANKANQTLPERAARASIPARRGKGVNPQADGAVAATSQTGTLLSSDGAFVIVYDYHDHD